MIRPDIADHPARVLIVDDEGPNRRLLEIMLTREGYVLLTAASGEDALALVAQDPPDLILLDIVMPGMDGYRVAGEIKGNLATKNIPIIMVSGLGNRDARMLGLRAGAEDFLAKPVDRAELCVRVRNLLRLKAYGDYHDKYSQMLEGEVGSRTADLVERTRTLEQQTAVLTEQATLLDLAQDAIVVRDMESRILFWNRGAEAMYGWLSEEALGKNTNELLQTEFSEPLEAIEATLVGQGLWVGEAIHHKRDGRRLIVASRWTLQRDAAGAPIRVLTINMDVTERKEAEQALEQSRQDQLRFKDEFLSHVSHELRSPLTAIKQFTTILLGGLAGELNTEQRQYQQIVLKNIQQLQSMIDDLLEVTRLETGKVSVEPESLSVSDAVTDTLNTLKETARAKGVTLTGDVPSDLPMVYADRTRLRQVLIILVDNAVKFTPEGGAVRIQVRLLEQDPPFLRFEVSDTGCGISPEISERIFERLYQVSDPTERTRKGLGLGLYICKELVMRQGGHIWVESQPQQGSTFSFTLPVFALATSIAPLLITDTWPAESVALVMVEISLLDAWPSKESQEEWSREARSLVQRCLLPELDVVLPAMSSGEEGQRFLFVVRAPAQRAQLVAAFAHAKGASVLANRIREQFDRLPHLTQTGFTVSVSYSMLDPFPTDGRQSAQSVVTSMPTDLEQPITTPIIAEAIHRE